MKILEKTSGAVGGLKLQSFACPNCGYFWDDLVKEGEKVSCPFCVVEAEQQLAMPRVQLFKEGYYEHSSAEGVHASNLRDLEEDCEKNGNRVEDRGGIHYLKHRQRWI